MEPEIGIQSREGPKAVGLGPINCVGPINCDMFWFRLNSTIGNELSGGPVTCFYATEVGQPEDCPTEP
jgi:hypothetical protein